ncbi:MAG: flavodoxin family protein [Clostridia bacterium]|nr:flavodoxin family protein [Clostridia bacterium]
MKILLINGSPRINGNTTRALAEMEQVFTAQGIECETIRIGNREIRGCSGCGSCYKNGKCVFDDLVNEIAPKFEQADGLVIGSPVYYASANGTLIAFLDRLFYSTPFDKTMKVGAAIASARRGGLTATFDQLNKYFTISGMPVASGSYWNGVHGAKAGECEADAEGLQTMRTVAQNMAFLIKSIDLGKKTFGLPEKEKKIRTNFVR